MLLVAIIFLILVVIFAVQNAQMVAITFLTWSFTLNQALVVLGSASLGIIIGVVWAWFKSLNSRGRVKDLMRELESQKDKNLALEKAVAELQSRSLREKERHDSGPEQPQ